MRYNINEKILFLPPFISTSWEEIKYIRFSDSHLIIEMKNETVISIPDLTQEIVELVFDAHYHYLEKQTNSIANAHTEQSEQVGHAHIQINPFRLGATSNSSFQQFSSNMQHNPEMAHTPNFPAEILNKIAAIAKVVVTNEVVQFPKAEPHCNCPHCQIARAIHAGHEEKEVDSESVELIEEEIEDKDLAFEQWNIVSKGEQVYEVINKLDPHEQYSVFLGEPIGCNCGKSGCEHILAVLRS